MTRKTFQLVAGNVVLDFVNTLDDRFSESGPQELLLSYDDLVRFAVQSGLLSRAQGRTLTSLPRRPEQRDRVLARAIELRETLAGVAYALLEGGQSPAAALDRLETYFEQARAFRKLAIEENRLVWTWPRKMLPVFPLLLLADAAGDLLLSPRVHLMRSCAKETCGWLFLDTSKNHTRRWCDMKLCGNRTKVKKFHERQASRKSTSRGTKTPAR